MSQRLLVATRKGLFDIRREKPARKSASTSSKSKRRPSSKPSVSPASWKIHAAHFLGDNVSAILRDPRDGTIYAAFDHGHFGVKLKKSADDGATWSDAAPPAYPEGETREASWTETDKTPKPAAVKLVWVLEPAGGARDAGSIWAGTIPGGLFRSSDYAATWALNRPLWDRPERKKWFGGGYPDAGVHSICVHPRNSKHLSVGISCGGMWVSDDDAASWTCKSDGMFAEYMPPERQREPEIQDPHRLAMCPSKPAVIWTQHHNGIFRTTDGGKLWKQIENVSPSHFGFAVAVHPDDPDTAWFVPAIKDEKRIPVNGRVVVIRTTDGGKSFETLTRGLPQRHAYDLTFRHGLAIDDTGKRLAFASTTGSLWLSENSGDSWQSVSAHLPPIYAVRFIN